MKIDPQSLQSTRSLPRGIGVPYQHVLFIATIIIYVAARLWHLTSSCLWFDEIFSLHAARHSWRELPAFAAADLVHPPLFYALLKIWIAFGGESLTCLRVLPFLFSVAAIVPFIFFCRALDLKSPEINLALLLLAVNGYLIKYAQEVRMYSLLFLLTLCSLWLFVRFLAEEQARKFLLALSVVNVLLVYAHYYGWLVLTGEFVVVLIWERERVKSFLISLIAPVVLFIPWVLEVFATSRGPELAQNIGWAARPRLAEIAQLLTLLTEPFYFRQSSTEGFSPWLIIFSLLLFGLPLLLLFWRRWKDRGPEKTVRLVTTFLLLPVVIAFGLSWILPQSIWGTRHLIILAAPFAILAAIALLRLRPVEAKFVFLIMIAGWFATAGVTAWLRPKPVYAWCAWNDLAQQLKQRSGVDGTNVYAFEDLTAYHLWFALDANSRRPFHVGVIKGLPGIVEDKAYFLPRNFDEVRVLNEFPRDENHFWIAFRDTNLDQTRPPLKTAADLSYRTVTVLQTNAGGQREFLIELVRK